jgi:arsenical pump membrane protein
VERSSAPWTAAERQGLVLVLAVLGAYPIVAYLGGSVWLVASTGALLSILLCRHHGATSARQLIRSGVSWEILVFLFGIFMIAIGLRNAGIVGHLTSLYSHSQDWVIGGMSAIGSAAINNHSMALTNLLALRAVPGVHQHQFLAALIGGDLGPRLLPMGSLAGLLWLASLRRLGIEVSLRRFVVVGATVTVPALAMSLGLLALAP